MMFAKLDRSSQQETEPTPGLYDRLVRVQQFPETLWTSETAVQYFAALELVNLWDDSEIVAPRCYLG